MGDKRDSFNRAITASMNSCGCFEQDIQEIASEHPWSTFANVLHVKCLLARGRDVEAKQLREFIAPALMSYNYYSLFSGVGMVSSDDDDSMIIEEEVSIIDHYLNNIPKRKKAPMPHPDQVNPDLSLQYSEQTDVITENLAKIYEKQGLYDEAIEVYHQLSLNYPEKSVYFANQIEKLKI